MVDRTTSYRTSFASYSSSSTFGETRARKQDRRLIRIHRNALKFSICLSMLSFLCILALSFDVCTSRELAMCNPSSRGIS